MTARKTRKALSIMVPQQSDISLMTYIDTTFSWYTDGKNNNI